MDTAQWPQELVVPSGTSNSSGGGGGRSQMAGERRARPQKEQALNCPRCNSTNTKFCYYNNYSLTQPRYFCKTCRRYWTEGGSLRNVPVGGGSRKNKRPSSSSAAAATANTTNNSSSSVSTSAPVQNPKFNEGRDLNLSFPLPEFSHDLSISTAAAPPAAVSAMELLRSTAGRGLNLNPFAPMNSVPMPEFPSAGFVPVHDYRSSSLSFPLDAGYVPESRLLFPFDQDSRPVSSSNNNDHNKGQEGGDNPGFWNGMMGGSGGGSGSW